MGDRITRYYPCKQTDCDGEVEEYDHPSGLLFSSECDKCGWRDPRQYYEITPQNVVLCTPEQARENGGLVVCKSCRKEVMGSWIEGDGCIECREK